MNLSTSYRLVVLIFTCIIYWALINSCRKLDTENRSRPRLDPAERFLVVPSGAPSALKRVAETIRKQNNESHFLDWFAEKFGYPVWNKCQLFNPVSGTNARTSHVPDTLAFIPLVLNGIDEVHSFLACAIEQDSVKIRLLRGDSYAAYGKTFNLDTLSAETVALECMVLEYKVFNHDAFRINDLELFLQSPAGTSNESRFLYIKDVSDSTKGERKGNFSGRSTDAYIPMWTTYCVTWTVEGDQGQVVGVPPGGTPDYSYDGNDCYDVLTWFEIINGTPTGTVPVQGSGGGGGGSEPWYDADPCRAVLGADCNGLLTEGWVQISDVETNNYNVLWVDTIGYSSSLQSEYPCMYDLIHDSMPNSNYISQLAGSNVFLDSSYFHLTFDTSTTYTQEGEAGAHTISTNVAVDNNGYSHFYAVIKFNGWYLRNATKEWKVSRIIHECMHAVFGLRWQQYLAWLQNHNVGVDSFYIKSKFPIYWKYINNQTVSLSEEQDHEIMGSDYFSYFSSIASQFYNPSAPSNIRDTVLKALGYGGLKGTTVWYLLPNLGIDTCKYRNINLTAAESLIGTQNVSGCASFTTHYIDSLKLSTGCH